MASLNFFIQDFHNITAGNYIVKTYSGKDSISTAYSAILSDNVPKGYDGILVELALDNSVDADVTLYINGKEQGHYGFPVKSSAFPANMEGQLVLVPIPENAQFELRARNLGDAVDLKWRAVVVLVRK